MSDKILEIIYLSFVSIEFLVGFYIGYKITK